MVYNQLSKIYYKNPELYDKTYKDKFNSEYAVHLGLDIGKNPAFFITEPGLYEKIDSIRKNDKEIMKICRDLPKVALMKYEQRCLIDEIMLTNDIEGVRSTRKEINELLIKPNLQNRFKGLVNRYKKLGNQELTLNTCNDIKNIYDELVGDEISKGDPENAPDGEIFRKSVVNVHTVTDRVIHQGITPESKIKHYVDSAIALLNNRSINIFFRIAIFHYFFGYIHPFYDGNGRTSRFISSYHLSRELEELIGYRLSYTIRQNVKKYYDAFEICNNPKNKGDLTPFVFMFIDIIETSAINLKEALKEHLDQLNSYTGQLKALPHSGDKRYSDIYYVLLQATLFSERGISLKEMATGFGISYSTADKRLKSIPDELIVKKIADRTGHYYLNLEYFDELIEKKIKENRFARTLTSEH
jgi:Fic family protein